MKKNEIIFTVFDKRIGKTVHIIGPKIAHIKLENIRGLEDGRPEAKAEVIVEMAALGYNDFLFADDAIQNVKAVQEVLDVLDVKGKTYQVEQKFSLDMDKKFNEILE